MKPVSLADISYEQGLQLLSLRKQAIDSGKIRRMTKEAMDNTYLLQDVGTDMFEKLAAGGFLDGLKSNISGMADQASGALNNAASGAKNWYGNLDPSSRDALKKGLIGTGLGAGAGLGASLVNGEGHYGRNMLMGGVAGGAIGGGLGLAQNPEIADKIQDRFSRWAKPTAQPEGKLPAPGGAPQATAAPEGKPEPLSPEAQRIMDIKDPLLREQQINKLQTTADSYAPEVVAGGTGAGIVGGTGYAARKLHQYQQYDPAALAQALLDGKGDPKAIANRLGLDVDSSDWKQMVGSSSGASKLTKQIAEHQQLRKSPLGNVSSDGGEQALKSLLGDKTELAMRRGFKGRPVRGGALLTLLGLAGSGLAHTYGRYNQNKQTRDNAASVLQNLIRAEQRKSGN